VPAVRRTSFASAKPPSQSERDALIDRASAESFPASDPPAYTAVSRSGAPSREGTPTAGQAGAPREHQ